jgi:hypothetical protein
MAEGVAHAPHVTDSDIDSGTDDDVGGTERLPGDVARSAALTATFRSRLAFFPQRTSVRTPICRRPSIRGTVLPRLCSPRFSFALGHLARVQGSEKLSRDRFAVN